MTDPLAAEASLEIELSFSRGEKLRATQSNSDETGGIHAVAVFDTHNTLLAHREDSGR